MERLKPVDVVIVGGGWCGLLMAKEIISRTSLSVFVLERGASYTRQFMYRGWMSSITRFGSE